MGAHGGNEAIELLLLVAELVLFNHDVAGQVLEKIASEQIIFALFSLTASVDVSSFLLRLAASFDVIEQGLHLAILDTLKLLEI